MKKFSPIAFIKNEIIGSENTFHAWSVLAAALGVLAIGFYLSSPSLSFQGVAGSREHNVNFEYPVEVKAVHVIPGQKVKKGDLLLELNQFDLDARIRELNTLIVKLRAEKAVRDQMNQAVGNRAASQDDPLSLELRELEVEREYLHRRRDNLYVFAEIDGIVGSVNFRKGERAQGFVSLVTISPESPTFVEGFVHESINSNVKVGTKVKVSSITNESEPVEGRVISVGSRFVQAPPRLSPNPNSAVNWGREVMVEIPRESGLLLGEKVIISPVRSWIPSSIAQADEEGGKIEEEKIVALPVNLPFNLRESTRFEASGAVYLPDLHKFAVVSDDTTEKNDPWLFLLSESGEVDERPMQLPNLDSIVDAESISTHEGYLYVMSSLREDKKKGQSAGRFYRVRREGLQLTNGQSIAFGKILKKAIEKSSDPVLASLAKGGLKDLEVEAHTIRGGDLFLALKEPLTEENGTVVIRISNVNRLFEKESGEVEVWKVLRIASKTPFRETLSDMLFVGDSLFFTTSCRGQICGGLWQLTKGETEARLLRAFETDKPEGLAFHAEKNRFLLTFDLGKDGSKYVTIRGPQQSR